MAHMIEAEVPGLTRENAERMIETLEPLFKRAPGFVFHASGPSNGGWRVVEVWNSEEDYARWYKDNIERMMPPGSDVGTSHYDIEAVIKP